MWGRRALKHTGIPGACVSFSVKGDAGATHSHCPYLRRSLLQWQCIMYVCLYVGRSGRHAAGPPGTYYPQHANTRSLYTITPTVVVVLRILRGHLHFYDPLHLHSPYKLRATVPCVYGRGGGTNKVLTTSYSSYTQFCNIFNQIRFR